MTTHSFVTYKDFLSLVAPHLVTLTGIGVSPNTTAWIAGISAVLVCGADN